MPAIERVVWHDRSIRTRSHLWAQARSDFLREHRWRTRNIRIKSSQKVVSRVYKKRYSGPFHLCCSMLPVYRPEGARGTVDTRRHANARRKAPRLPSKTLLVGLDAHYPCRADGDCNDVMGADGSSYRA